MLKSCVLPSNNSSQPEKWLTAILQGGFFYRDFTVIDMKTYSDAASLKQFF